MEDITSYGTSIGDDKLIDNLFHDGRPAGSTSYMWVHLTGELSPVPKIIVYEYQKQDTVTI